MTVRTSFAIELIGLISATKMVSEARGISLKDASAHVRDQLVKNGALIYTMCAGELVRELGEAWYEPACSYVAEALGDEWWIYSEKLEQPMLPDRYLRDELAVSSEDARRLLGLLSAVHRLEGKENSRPEIEITGQTFSRLQRAIAAFPSRYPNYRERSPKLDDDIRPWLAEVSLAETEAERRVFGAIIREHFKL